MAKKSVKGSQVPGHGDPATSQFAVGCNVTGRGGCSTEGKNQEAPVFPSVPSHHDSGMVFPLVLPPHGAPCLSLGGLVIGTNEFELFTDFGVKMKARSPALQTFLVQMAGLGGCLPTVRAAKGGGYNAIIQSSRVGPDGGRCWWRRQFMPSTSSGAESDAPCTLGRKNHSPMRPRRLS